MMWRNLLTRIQIDPSYLVSVFEINWKLIINTSNIHCSWVLEPCGLLRFPVVSLLPANGSLIASGLVEKACFDQIDMEWYWGKMGYSHSIWLVFPPRSWCNLPFDISDCFSRAPLQEVRVITWISLNRAHCLLTVFSESMISAMQMFHLWH